CSGIEEGELFNRMALEAALWTRRKLTKSNLQWLKKLPEGPTMVDDTFAICHGTPIDEDAYIFGEIEALNVFRHTDFPITFFGHSHFPVIFALSPDAITTILTVAPSFRFKLRPGVRYLVNPGSVGQPRDGNPLASFAMFDSATRMVSIHRIPYQIQATQQKIMKAGLPRPLADRLGIGR
ncbi:MAG TPA: metallophosphoesterase, partial [Vicinamibacteria bacterium]|nr:metallophosphoesterase [Vicinamibacteria bacterium]